MKNKKLQAILMMLPFIIAYIVFCYYDKTMLAMTLFFGAAILAMGLLVLFLNGISYLLTGEWFYETKGDE